MIVGTGRSECKCHPEFTTAGSKISGTGARRAGRASARGGGEALSRSVRDGGVQGLGDSAVAFVSFTLYALCSWVLTSKVFPLGTAVAPLCRDIATLVEALGFLAVSLVAARVPRLLDRRLFLIVPSVLAVAGSAMLWLGSASVWTATSALCLLLLSAVFVMLAAGCALSRLDERLVGPCVLAGLVVSYLVRFCLVGAAELPMLAVFACGQIAAIAVAYRAASGVLDVLRSGAAPEELALTNPFSFLPRTHRLFVCVLLFQAAYGASLSFGEVDSTPLATFAGVVPLLVVCVAGVAMRRLPSGDTVFGVALLFLMAGILFAPLSQELGGSLASNLLEAGSSCFMLVYWTVLAGLALRNRTGVVPLFSWSGFLLSLGVVAGAALGRAYYAVLGSDSVAGTVTVGVVVLVLVAFALFGLRKFSFDDTVRALVGSPEVAEAPAAPTDSDSGDDAVAGMPARYGLTAREAEVFALLAQGRNGAHIQRQLGVSYNTIKTHVAHIYAKLGVHSHQELIDLVEAVRDGEG